jgi:hypothetical protein
MDSEETSQMKDILPPEHLKTWMYDFSLGIENRCQSELNLEGFDIYGESKLMYMRGIAAGISKWQSNDGDTYHMKIEFSGELVDGINDGERLAVYSGENFEIDSF